MKPEKVVFLFTQPDSHRSPPPRMGIRRPRSVDDGSDSWETRRLGKVSITSPIVGDFFSSSPADKDDFFDSVDGEDGDESQR